MHGSMNKAIAFLLAIAACGDNNAYPVDAPPDAAVDGAVDAGQPDTPPDATDATPQTQRGCSNMGNLPDAMTAVLTEADPVPSALLVELQEMHVGDKHAPRSWVVPAGAFCLTGGTGTLNNGVWSMTATNTKLEAPLVLPHGTTIDAVVLYYIRQAVSLSGYTLTLKSRSLQNGQPLADVAAFAITQNNGTAYPNIDSILGNASGTPGLPYTVPPFIAASTALRLEVVAVQLGPGAFDAQLLGVVLLVRRH